MNKFKHLNLETFTWILANSAEAIYNIYVLGEGFMLSQNLTHTPLEIYVRWIGGMTL